MNRAILLFSLVAGCSSGGRMRTDGGGGGGGDMASSSGGDSGQSGCGSEFQGCYTVYAHSDHVLYEVDLVLKQLVKIGNFNAPLVNGKEDVITDLAVAPDNTIWAISHTELYTADPNDGHVT